MVDSHKFGDEISGFTGRKISLETSEGRIYNGILVSIDEKLNAIIEIVDSGEKIIISGNFVKEIRLARPFDVKAFVERLNHVFPGLVKVVENSIIVMDKIKVTERGVEGNGLAADRVRTIFEEFVREKR
ncbi:MAG: Lsm family RNA-binding protein [Nitrososphaerales archaeon]